MSELSTKPYLIRAIYEWCTDSGLTPYVVIAAGAHTRLPMEFVKDGQVVLNIGASATHNLLIGNDMIRFSARFNGVAREIEAPIEAVVSIYAHENAQGLSFAPEPPGAAAGVDQTPPDNPPPPAPRGRPQLKIVK